MCFVGQPNHTTKHISLPLIFLLLSTVFSFLHTTYSKDGHVNHRF